MIDLLDEAGVGIAADAVTSDVNGYWERRALTDGRYRVEWEPAIDPARYAETIPPAETIAVNPNRTIQRVVQIVEIRGANRVRGVDFGIPPRSPLPVAGLPASGQGSHSSVVGPWLVAGLFAASIGAAVVLAPRLRRANR